MQAWMPSSESSDSSNALGLRQVGRSAWRLAVAGWEPLTKSLSILPIERMQTPDMHVQNRSTGIGIQTKCAKFMKVQSGVKGALSQSGVTDARYRGSARS